MTLQKTTIGQKLNSENNLLQARESSVAGFGNIEHRLEFVEMVNGVEYINDSKATDINSSWYSLEYMQKPVIWLVGTSDQETDFSLFTELVNEKVKLIICLGKNKDMLKSALSNHTDQILEANSVQDAVKLAAKQASNDDVVLFSPGCSGFDCFQNYKDRGQQFRKEVQNLVKTL